MEPPKRGFAMVPHRMTLDTKGISHVTIRLYAALHSLAKGSKVLKGFKVDQITGLIGIEEATFRRSMKELESGSYVRRKNKQSRWFEVEFIPETSPVLDHPRSSKSITSDRVGPSSRSLVIESVGEYSITSDRTLAHPRSSKAGALPISEFDKGIDKKNRTKKISSESGEAPKNPDALSKLIAWLPAVSSDPAVVKKLAIKVPLWAERIAERRPEFAPVALSWIKDALTDSTDVDDPVRYAQAIIARYVEAGGRPGVELPGPAPRKVAPPGGSATNVAPPGETEAKLASIRSDQARLDSLKARWGALPEPEREAIRSQFDCDNRRPPGMHEKFWQVTRLAGCMELMDRLNVRHSEAS